MKQQLNQYKNINSVNIDFFNKILLKSKKKVLSEQDITYYLNVSEQFDKERQNNNIYFIYGGLEYFSILNKITTNYIYFEDFFNKNNIEEEKNIYNSFDFYLVKPIDNLDSENKYYDEIHNNIYIKKYEVIANNNDFIIEKQAYSTNIFGEEKYLYFINKNIDLNYNIDWLGKPITELYIVPIYKKSYTGLNDEKIYINNFEYENNNINIVFNEVTGETINYNIGDIIDGDIISWNINNYNETKLYNKEIRIKTFYEESGTTKSIEWKYNPFIPIRIDYLENEINIQNISGKTYSEIPEYAIKLDDKGNYIWRNLIDKGYIDNLYKIGTNFPFINGKHYIYNNIILDVIPNLDDLNTYNKFQPIMLQNYIIDNNNANISNYGDIC